MLIRVMLPLVAFAAVLVGLIVAEPPPTEAELKVQQQRAMLLGFQQEQTELLSRLDELQRDKQLEKIKLAKLEEVEGKYPGLEDTLDRISTATAAEKAATESSIAAINEDMSAIESRAEEWVRSAYQLTPDALPPGYLARILWKADGAALAETSAIARELRATLHISETAAQSFAARISTIARSSYARRTLVTAAGALATLALIETAEPAFGWVFERWWKLLAAALAATLTLLFVVQLQHRKVVD